MHEEITQKDKLDLTKELEHVEAAPTKKRLLGKQDQSNPIKDTDSYCSALKPLSTH